MKVGRNDLCPCGSGKKFKKCHLSMPPVIRPAMPSGPNLPPEFWRDLKEHRRDEQARAQTFGQIRPILHIPEFQGHSLVGVRNRLYYSKKWRFFSDFLFEYGPLILGREWLDVQKASSRAEHHPAYVWHKQAYEYIQRQTRRSDGAIVTLPNGPMAACNNFYYDLYTVDANGMLDDLLLTRLRNREQFQGALHELFCEATCLRAGFSIVRENERDRTKKHAEFMAVHNASSQHLLVEAKSRHRSGVMGRPGAKDHIPDTRFRRLINQAIAKDPE
jgi:hypothetical protein